MSTANVDRARQEAFGQRMVTALNDSAMVLSVSLGHRTGLFDAMADLPPSTSQQIAAAAGLNERYVREWLGAMVTSRVIDYDPASRTYRLPPEHAAWLTRKASPSNLGVPSQWLAVLGCVEDKVVEAFRHGRGVPYSAYERFHEVMAEESGETVVAGLLDHIVPLVPGMADRLQRGIEVADIGCGSGRAMLALAEHFPDSRFTGFDFSEEGIAAANAAARERGLKNVQFAVHDAAEKLPQKYDLITAFDAIHDQARPADVLWNIASALQPGGVFLMQDILASSHVHQNMEHPMATFIYTISTMHCMSVSLAHGGPGLGAAWGKEKALEMLRDAGFQNVEVRELPHDMMNYWYVARLRA
jgi:2-polyprenyl-3-methyl-5-hydroxy-6-metoxy-1,4-benzoquinol methylase